MKRLSTPLFTIAIALFAFVATAQDKGPAFKNAKVSEKYAGTSVVKMSTEPGAVKGPMAKNNRFSDFKEPQAVMTAGADGTQVAQDRKYKVVDLQDSESKITRNVKGPKFKNQR